jgi:hypothetical protein
LLPVPLPDPPPPEVAPPLVPLVGVPLELLEELDPGGGWW